MHPDLGSGTRSRLLIAVLIALSVVVGLRAWSTSSRTVGDTDWESLAAAGAFHTAASGATDVTLPREFAAMPGYPLVLAAIAFVDPAFKAAHRQALRCWPENTPNCPRPSLPLLWAIQFLTAIGCLALVALITMQVTASTTIAALAMVLFYAQTRLGQRAGSLHPALIFQFLTLLTIAVSVAAVRRGSVTIGIGSGAVAAVAALFEPAALAMIPAIALAAATRPSRPQLRSVTLCAPLIGAVVTLTFSFWLLGRLGFMPDWAATHAGINLAQRASTNDLDAKTWIAGLLIFTPVFGELLEGLLLPLETSRNLGQFIWGSTLYSAKLIYIDVVAKSQLTPIGELQTLAQKTVIQQPLQFLAGVIPVFLRGFWSAAGLFGLLGALQVWRMRAYARVDQKTVELRTLVWPAAAMLVASTLTTANLPIHNPLMPLVFAFALAYVAAGW